LEVTGEKFGIKGNELVVGILPGSRHEAYDNLALIGEALGKIREKVGIERKEVVFLLALPGSMDEQIVKSILKDIPVKLIKGKFGDVLNISQVIIGLAGMANEQAAGMAKPVVAFVGKGPQTTAYRFSIQNMLTGGAIFVVDADPKVIADKVWALSQDQAIKQELIARAKERCQPGAAPKIASEIIKILTDVIAS
jgi:hypothetical protein